VTGNGKVGLVHAVVPAMDAVNQYFDLAGLAAVNLLDESLLPMAERRGGVDEVATERLASAVQLAIDADVVAVVVTCHAYSGAAARVAERYADVPVLSIDRVLVETAVGQARRIGLVGTVAVGLRQQERLVSDVARQRGKKVEIRSRLREDAVEALRAGDRARH